MVDKWFLTQLVWLITLRCVDVSRMWAAVMSFSSATPTLTFEKAFRGKHTNLALKVDTSHGLWNQLLDREVLTSQQISTCQVLTGFWDSIQDLQVDIVALWVEHRTSDWEVAGSIPAWALLVQVIHTLVPLSPSSISWYRCKNQDSKSVMAHYGRGVFYRLQHSVWADCYLNPLTLSSHSMGSPDPQLPDAILFLTVFSRNFQAHILSLRELVKDPQASILALREFVTEKWSRFFGLMEWGIKAKKRDECHARMLQSCERAMLTKE